MRIGLMLGDIIGPAPVQEQVQQAVDAESEGFDTAWFGQLSSSQCSGCRTRIHPKPQYLDLFVADRYERFGGDMCVIWLPGQDSNLQPCG
jgi:hypothetical protein